MSKTLTQTVKTEYEAVAKIGYLAIWPNNDTIADPDYVGEGIAPQIPEYPNDWIWIQHKLRQNNKQICHNGLKVIANLTADKPEIFE
jgi:hypothetical protein